ncbi:MAG TPA: flippase activity-associated protein Agl23 [Sedimentisphaerales bacterium]|nr:flippase activity-associated protein Agl23 [Sedimentisphaerales bacterium]
MTKRCCVLILAATIVAIALRLPRLQQRPMHGDEAVHAIKFGELLAEGVYTYNPDEYHGPTLNYLTLIPARLSSAEKLTQVSEVTLRIVPVFFGVLLVLLVLPAGEGLGPGAAVYAAVLTAISPAMVFYSRYYIQEMLLVCFTFCAIVFGYRYARNKNIAWALLTGMSLGLMHATKETCIIAFGSMFLALLLMLLIRRPKDSFINAVKTVKTSHLIAGLAAGAIVSALFYSSFLTNPGGILDSVRTYTTYFDRAGGNSLHIHPWYYYIKMLIYSRYGDGPRWTEALIVLLAVVGFIAAMTKKGLSCADVHLLRFIGFYTLVLTVVYSVIPYKTPWCMLGFLHGMILLAGVGAVVLVKLLPNVLPRLIILMFLFEGSVLLTWQSYLSNYKFYADSRNPYVYAHPTIEVFTITEKIEEYAGVHEDGYDIPIDVICPEGDYWPLPWYLRSFKKIRWSNEVVNDAPTAPLIIASPDVEAALTNKLYALTPLEKRQMYMFIFDEPYYVWLRPKIKLLGFVRKDLWDSFQRKPAPQDVNRKAAEK